LVRNLVFPFLQKRQILFFFSEFVGQHLRNLVAYRIPSEALRTDDKTFSNFLLLFENVQFKRMMFVDGASEYFHQFSFDTNSSCTLVPREYKTI
jgi:hypothetical protein